MKSWYSAKLLFQSTINDASLGHPLCEESIRILLADTEEEARARAQRVGVAAQHEYQNEQNETVKWEFVSVVDIQEIDENSLVDGAEIYSELCRKD